jgi:hypothetical protein
MLIYKRLHISAKTSIPQALQTKFQAKHKLYMCAYSLIFVTSVFRELNVIDM